MAIDLREELMNDSTAYCCYCGTEQTSFGCCGENHFETFAEMDEKRQKEFLDAEDAQAIEAAHGIKENT